jgi:hypothetical protein
MVPDTAYGKLARIGTVNYFFLSKVRFLVLHRPPPGERRRPRLRGSPRPVQAVGVLANPCLPKHHGFFPLFAFFAAADLRPSSA